MATPAQHLELPRPTAALALEPATVAMLPRTPLGTDVIDVSDSVNVEAIGKLMAMIILRDAGIAA